MVKDGSGHESASSEEKSTRGSRLSRPALGRGLAALLPGSAQPSRGLLSVPISQLKPEPNQPRQRYARKPMEELAASIRARGVLQPILVRKESEGLYRIIAGERRWRAAERAGLEEVPVVVKEISEDEVFEVALIENIQREDLSPVEEALAYQRLLSEYGLTQEDLATRVGKDRSTITNSLRLLRLPNGVKGALMSGDLSVGHAKVLLGLEHEGLMEKLAGQVVAKGMSVRETEKLVQKQRSPKKKSPRGPSGNPLKPMASELERLLGRRCEVRHRSGSEGELIIHFEGLDDGEELIGRLMAAAKLS